jgi:Metal-dependent hydrolases of the beta-lactamase superfamily III
MVAAAQTQGKFAGDFHLYAHPECLEALQTMVNITVKPKLAALMGKSIVLHPLADGRKETILGDELTFFDIGSTKCKQFGFAIGKKFVFLGDEPYREHEKVYAENAEWLLHEAFCLYGERDIFKPYEKHHATVKEACETAEALRAKNLILYHTEDKRIKNRKALYTKEGAEYFSGNLYVPDDLETFTL